MDGRLVLVVFGVAVLLPCCTVVAANSTTTTATTATTDQNRTTEDLNQTTSEQNVTTAAHTTAATTDPPSPSAVPIDTTIAPNSDNCDGYSEGLGNGIGIGIGIMLGVVVVTLAVLVTLLWRRQWILPCSAGAPAVFSDQVRTVKTESNGPKTYTKGEPARDKESAKPQNYASLYMDGPQHIYEPLQDVNNSEETDKAAETRAAQAKGAEKKLPPQRSHGNAKDEQNVYQNCDPSERRLRTEKGRTGRVPNTPGQREKKKKITKTGPQGSASSDNKQA